MGIVPAVTAPTSTTTTSRARSFCVCGQRLGYGRHRGRHGGIYEYFSCLSRVQRGGRCPAPYFPVERTERAIVRRYKRETYPHEQQNEVREVLRAYVHAKVEVARRESERHSRRLRELTGQQQKLVQLYYKGGVSEEVLKAEQQRIETERGKAQRWSDAADREVEDVMAALDDALIILDDHVIYETLPHSARRLVNQAIFLTLTVRDPDTIKAKRTPVYDEIARLARNLQDRPRRRRQTAPKRPEDAQEQDPTPPERPRPHFRGRGSYIDQMAERAGRGANPPQLWTDCLRP